VTAAQTADTVGPTSVLAGAYTVAQARSGEAVFRRICAECHAVTQFQEPAFLRSWAGRTARDLFELIRTQMPQDNPGQLRREEYAAVLAYIFELNALPPAATALPTDDAALRRIRIERRP
jgi:mono/diheme cytochrome c family protein